MRHDQPDLARLQRADEVPAEPPRRALDLLGELLRAVLADERDAGVGEDLDVVGGDVLDRDEDFDVGGVPAGARGRRVDALAHRAELGADPLDAQRSHANPAWRPAAAPSRRWEK